MPAIAGEAKLVPVQAPLSGEVLLVVRARLVIDTAAAAISGFWWVPPASPVGQPLAEQR